MKYARCTALMHVTFSMALKAFVGLFHLPMLYDILSTDLCRRELNNVHEITDYVQHTARHTLHSVQRMQSGWAGQIHSLSIRGSGR